MHYGFHRFIGHSEFVEHDMPMLFDIEGMDFEEVKKTIVRDMLRLYNDRGIHYLSKDVFLRHISAPNIDRIERVINILENMDLIMLGEGYSISLNLSEIEKAQRFIRSDIYYGSSNEMFPDDTSMAEIFDMVCDEDEDFDVDYIGVRII